MKKIEKQAELEKHLALTLAVLDYHLLVNGGTIVYDDIDIIGEYYEQQKVKAREYYKQRKLGTLTRQLQRLTSSLQHHDVVEVEGFIKKHSGHEIDVLAKEKKTLEMVLLRGNIDTKEEGHDIGFMLGTNKIAGNDKLKIKILRALYSKFSQEMFEAEKLRPKRNKGYTESIIIEEKNGATIEHITISTGPKPSHFKEREIVSPDGKRKLILTEYSDKGHSSTSVSIAFEKVRGCPYSVSGIYPNINAFWKDNYTIIIETKESYNANAQNKKVRSFGDTIFIEYIET